MNLPSLKTRFAFMTAGLGATGLRERSRARRRRCRRHPSPALENGARQRKRRQVATVARPPTR